MPTNVAIEDALLTKALKAGGGRTKKETVTRALEEFIQRRQQRKIHQGARGIYPTAPAAEDPWSDGINRIS